MNIELDPKIRDWVFLPMIYVTVSVGLIKLFYTHYSKFTSSKQLVTSKDKFIDNSDKKLFAKCDRLARSGMFLTEQSFNTRRTYLCKPQGYLKKRGDKPQADMTKMMMDSQSMMFSSMKGTIGMAVTMMLQMAWVNYFFSGFILAKMPFPLTQKFRGMMQNGVDMDNLDVRYVSGLSFYFLVMFGMGELQNLLIDDEALKLNEDEMEEAAPQMGAAGPGMMPPMNPMMGGMPGMPGQQGPDAKKQFQTQAENLQLVYHRFMLKDGDKMALARLKGKLG